MFGLTKREQRWKAEQKAIETLVPLVVAVVQARVQVEIAKSLEKAIRAQTPKLPAVDNGEGGQ